MVSFSFAQSNSNTNNKEKFTIVERVPIYPGCDENKSNAELKECMSNSITTHVGNNFNTNIAIHKNLVGIQRIAVVFKIDTNGEIIDVRARGPHPALEKEAVRVIKLLPKLKPGTQKGKPVVVPYALPIKFEVEAPRLPKKKIKKNLSSVSQPDIYPTHKRCKDTSSPDVIKECTTNKIIDFIRVSFDTEMASKLFPQDQSTSFKVEFIINKKGKIENINAKAYKKEIAIEAIRVLKLLPKLKTPGFKNGKPIDTPFSFIMTVHFTDF